MEHISPEVLEVIKKAIELEINGRSFFEHAAEITHNRLGQKMFRKLAQDEIEHLNTFSQMFTSIAGTDDWKKLVTGPKQDVSPLIEELKRRLEGKGRGERASDLEAISIGMELERTAIDFFQESASQTTDTKAREIFERISDEERSHYDLLQAQYDYVTNSGNWFDIAEFRMDGKY